MTYCKIKSMYSIYLITNKVNNKVYVGKTKFSPEERFNHHKWNRNKKSCVYLYNSFDKHGIESFHVSTLATCETNEEACGIEKMYIEFFNSADSRFGYNLTLGGDGGTHNEDTKKKISENSKKHWQRPEYRAIFENWVGENNPNYGRKATPEQIERQSQRMRGMNVGEQNPFFGRKHAEETKRIMSEKKKVQYLREGNPFFGKTHNIDAKIKSYETQTGKSYLEDEIIWMMMLCHKNVSKVASILECSYSHIYKRNQRLGLSPTKIGRPRRENF